VAAAVNDRFIPVRLEGRSHMDLVQQMGVRGAPTTIIFGPDGAEKHRISGFIAPDEYLKELDKAA
jgi:thioredoxin-related protein